MAVTEDDNEIMKPLTLEHQSSFSENHNEALYRSQTVGSQKSGNLFSEGDEEMKEDMMDKSAFSDMFEYHVKNLVEFVDKRGIHHRKNQMDKMNDIVLYIQDESDFYEAWENVFRGEVPDY